MIDCATLAIQSFVLSIVDVIPDRLFLSSSGGREGRKTKLGFHYQNDRFRIESTGKASLITNKQLATKISQLKYPDEERANEKRVVLQVTQCEQ